MRYFRLLLICSLLFTAQRAQALELFGDFLYWRATEPVDWVLNTNRTPADQFVDYKTIAFNFAPGFRVGMEQQGDWDTRLGYTHFQTTSSESAAGNLTPAFLGSKLALPSNPIVPTPYYFDTGQQQSAINYNVLDWDLGKRYNPSDVLVVRPLVGLRAAWINQNFNTAFQGAWPSSLTSESIVERMHNNFWGIGPKVGVENSWTMAAGEEWQVSLMANFYTSFLLGFWSINDVTDIASTVIGFPASSQKIVQVHNRDFGALAFQTIVGLNLKYQNWSASAGYELNDWLNQCQIFDDATGPHNNDLLLQGLILRVMVGF
ncbi:MAG TPA: Lpg1974 family pore-forming outer membrane protein [Pirellulales bacterium]|jgi:hypothetical protein|nr:Lpg1974 family pore-forming outer membrane protein [Pirellulales bacterium]